MTLNFSAFKEPRGFVKVIQLIFAIVAFSTTCSFKSSVEFKLSCLNGTNHTAQSFPVAYPFDLSPFFLKAPGCNNSNVINYISIINLDSVSKSQFFVTIGVMAFIYSLGAMAMYSLYAEQYLARNSWPLMDLVGNTFFAVMFFVASIAWSTGVANLRSMTSADSFHRALQTLGDHSLKIDVAPPSYSSLTVSLVVGYFNILLWGASAWFVFKETEYHTPHQFRNPPRGGADTPAA